MRRDQCVARRGKGLYSICGTHAEQSKPCFHSLRLMSPMEIALEGLTQRKPLNLEVRDTTDGKGRGLFTLTEYKKGEFLCEFETAKVYPRKEMAQHIAEYSANDEGSYIIEAPVQGTWLCFDATRRFGGVGRYANHATQKKATAKLFRPLMVQGKHRIALLAERDMDAGEEVTFDYGCKPEGREWLMRRPRSVAPEPPPTHSSLTPTAASGRMRFTADEEKLVKSYFREVINCKRTASLEQCKAFLRMHPMQRTAKQIQVKVRNLL